MKAEEIIDMWLWSYDNTPPTEKNEDARELAARMCCKQLHNAGLLMEWVSVDDQIPERNTPLLVAAMGGVTLAEYTTSGSWKVKNGYLGGVTHWAIPNPPRP